MYENMGTLQIEEKNESDESDESRDSDDSESEIDDREKYE